MRFRHVFCIVALFTLMMSGLSPSAHADSWRPPKPTVTYESAALDARFIVTSSGRSDTLFACSGAIYLKEAGESEWTKVWSKPLQNHLSPVTALVANRGWRVVTFDNYYSVGYGDEVVVFYDEKGEVLKKYSLESLLSETELKQVPRSISSRWWRSKATLEESLGLLKVEVAQRREQQRWIKPILFNLLDGEIIPR
ncbi:MAG: hypothetical protein AB9917_16265 [Negativicutes bacterium]